MKAAGASVTAELTKSDAGSSQPSLVRRWLAPAWAAAIDLLFPPQCVACGSECEPVRGRPLLCATCDASLVIPDRTACSRCAMTCSLADLPRGTCGNCRGRKLLFAAARTIGPYQEALRRAVLQAKHAAFEPLAIALGQRLAAAVEQSPFAERPDLVVAVPMHWLKRLLRKTNPSLTIARSVAKHLDLPLASGLLKCRRYLRRQATLNPQERRRNVRGAFKASRRRNIADKRILLVDDVMTTGATAHEASRALLESGAAAVYVAVAARSSPEV